MNLSLMKSQLKRLEINDLYLLSQDVMLRIGSHVAGGECNENYINKQRGILDIIGEELKTRNN